MRTLVRKRAVLKAITTNSSKRAEEVECNSSISHSS